MPKSDVRSKYTDHLPVDSQIAMLDEWILDLAKQGYQAETNLALAEDREDREGITQCLDTLEEMDRSLKVLTTRRAALTALV